MTLRPRLQRWWMRFWYSHQGYGPATWDQGYGPATWDGENLNFDPAKSHFR